MARNFNLKIIFKKITPENYIAFNNFFIFPTVCTIKTYLQKFFGAKKHLTINNRAKNQSLNLRIRKLNNSY